jgi:hypothetical protein
MGTVGVANMDSMNPKEQACHEVGLAINEGSLGEIVAKHEQLILKYYEDVQEQAIRSFNTARCTAIVGFGVLIATVVCVFLLDALHRGNVVPNTVGSPAIIGVVSGALIEFIAGVTFWLYSQSAKQFSAFHICLERTHRYLIAYKMVEKIGAEKDKTLRDLVCIMASAPMIGQGTVNQAEVPRRNDAVRSGA